MVSNQHHIFNRSPLHTQCSVLQLGSCLGGTEVWVLIKRLWVQFLSGA